MKFSVIIPSRNRIDDVKRAIASVCSQSYPDIEVIVVNDGCDQEFIEQYQNFPVLIDSRIRIIDLPRTKDGHGASFSRNVGATHSSGDYILFLDDDDLWIDDTYVQRLHDAITHYHADIDVVFSHQQAADAQGQLNKKLWLNSYCAYAKRQGLPVDEFGFFRVNVKDLLDKNGFAHLNATVVSKPIFEKIQGFDNSVMYENDRDFFLRLIDGADKILCSDTIVAQHHIPDASKTANVSTKPNLLRKMQFREYFLNKLIMFGNKEEIRRSAKKHKAHTIKQIAYHFYKNKQYQLSHHYACEALLIGFNIKWAAFTAWLTILRLKAAL